MNPSSASGNAVTLELSMPRQGVALVMLSDGANGTNGANGIMVAKVLRADRGPPCATVQGRLVTQRVPPGCNRFLLITSAARFFATSNASVADTFTSGSTPVPSQSVLHAPFRKTRM